MTKGREVKYAGPRCGPLTAQIPKPIPSGGTRSSLCRMPGGKMRLHAIIGIALAASTLAMTAARSQTTPLTFDENAAALIQDLATKAAAQNITLVPQPEGL